MWADVYQYRDRLRSGRFNVTLPDTVRIKYPSGEEGTAKVVSEWHTEYVSSGGRDEWGDRPGSTTYTPTSRREWQLEVEYSGLKLRISIHAVHIHQDDIVHGEMWDPPLTPEEQARQHAAALADLEAYHGIRIDPEGG